MTPEDYAQIQLALQQVLDATQRPSALEEPALYDLWRRALSLKLAFENHQTKQQKKSRS